MPRTAASKRGEADSKAKVEHSAREVCPQSLLLKHLLSAHAVFLLHHAPSLADLYVRLTRPKFCAALARFWNAFVKDWEVLIHGSPAVDIFSGIKLAAGGELGVGVGEEEWGSGEREVLEGFVDRTEGLIDLVVSRFGLAENDTPIGDSPKKADAPWLGGGKLASSSEGVVFSGVHSVSRTSVAAIAKWMEWIYRYGQAAYGVQDSPHAPKRKRRRKPIPPDLSGDQQHEPFFGQSPRSSQSALQDTPPGIPPPIVAAANRSLDAALSRAETRETTTDKNSNTKSDAAGTDILMKYMTFGLYGSGWGLPASKPETENPQHQSGNPSEDNENKLAIDRLALDQRYQDGCFLIGLKGNLDEDGETDGEGGSDSGGHQDSKSRQTWNSRIILRTLHVERKRRQETGEEAQSESKEFPID